MFARLLDTSRFFIAAAIARVVFPCVLLVLFIATAADGRPRKYRRSQKYPHYENNPRSRGGLPGPVANDNPPPPKSTINAGTCTDAAGLCTFTPLPPTLC